MKIRQIAKEKILAELAPDTDWSEVEFGTKILVKEVNKEDTWVQAYYVGYLEHDGELRSGFYYTLSDSEDLFRTDTEPILHDWE